jgi:rare lipoprotein A (peptidoglycan hydrolase)
MKQDKAPVNPPDVSNVPDAVPVDVAYSRGGNKPEYQVWGKTYRVLDTHIGYKEQGIASWYGLKFHGHKTSNGEIYDIYKMSAAHKSLPIPSYARVTNLDNGKSVIVRVNDRGPFHEDRLIDLSYSAASRLEITQKERGVCLLRQLMLAVLKHRRLHSNRWPSPLLNRAFVRRLANSCKLGLSVMPIMPSGRSCGWRALVAKT